MSLFRESLIYVKYIEMNDILDSRKTSLSKIEKVIMDIGEDLDNKFSNSESKINNYIDIVDTIERDVNDKLENMEFNLDDASKIILNIPNLMKQRDLSDEDIVEKDLLSYYILSLYDKYELGL